MPAIGGHPGQSGGEGGRSGQYGEGGHPGQSGGGGGTGGSYRVSVSFWVTYCICILLSCRVALHMVKYLPTVKYIPA